MGLWIQRLLDFPVRTSVLLELLWMLAENLCLVSFVEDFCFVLFLNPFLLLEFRYDFFVWVSRLDLLICTVFDEK